jgi:uncharacterized repeat protein (TIGR03803 family)
MNSKFFPQAVLLFCGYLASYPAMAQQPVTLYSFSNTADLASGAGPSGITLGGDGVLYGTTTYGGFSTSQGNCTHGCGVAFSLTPPTSPGGAWTETLLWTFGMNQADGQFPQRLIMGPDGVLYGTTPSGGTRGRGTLFSLTPPASAPPGPKPSSSRSERPSAAVSRRRVSCSAAEASSMGPLSLAGNFRSTAVTHRAWGSFSPLRRLPDPAGSGSLAASGALEIRAMAEGRTPRWLSIRQACCMALRLPVARQGTVRFFPSLGPAKREAPGRNRCYRALRQAPATRKEWFSGMARCTAAQHQRRWAQVAIPMEESPIL